MGTKLNRRSYERLINEDIDWVKAQPRTLERDHVIEVLKASPEREYGQGADMKEAVVVFYEFLVTTQEFRLAARFRDLLGYVPERA